MHLGTITTEPRVWMRRRREAKLASMHTRRSLAVSLRRLLEAAEEPPALFSSAVPLRRGEILSARRPIDEIAEHLESDGPVTPEGVGLVERLLTFDGSPLYAPNRDDALVDELRHIRSALLRGA